MAARLPIEALKEGMILAQDVADRSGRPLAKAGDCLDARILIRMRAGGVSFVEVLEEASEAAPENSDIETRIETVLTRKFAGTEGNPLMNEIRALAKSHLAALRRVSS